MAKITTKRFIDSIYGFNWKGFSIENYWNFGVNKVNAVFLNYNSGFAKGGEYVKIYCDNQLYSYPNLKIEIYLLNRKDYGKQDLLLKTFSDWKVYSDYVENELFDVVKKLNIQHRKESGV